MMTCVEGDLFESSAKVLVNPVNTVGVMGKGLALGFKQRYPDMFGSYRTACREGRLQIGHLLLYRTPGKWVLNFPTKRHWRDPSRLEYIDAGLRRFVEVHPDWGISDIAFPALVCGNGRFDFLNARSGRLTPPLTTQCSYLAILAQGASGRASQRKPTMDSTKRMADQERTQREFCFRQLDQAAVTFGYNSPHRLFSGAGKPSYRCRPALRGICITSRRIHLTVTRLTALVFLVLTGSAWGRDVDFKDLDKERLPYGEAVTITGKLDELPANIKSIEVGALVVKSSVSGLPETQVDGTIVGDRWSVTVGPFPENAVATLSFSFSGKIPNVRARKLLSEVQAAADFKEALGRLMQQAIRRPNEAGEVYDVRRAAAFGAFANSAADALRKNLPNGLKLANGNEDFAMAFRSELNSPALLAAFTNLRVRADELRDALKPVCGSYSIDPCPVKKGETYPPHELLELADKSPYASNPLVQTAQQKLKEDRDRVVNSLAKNVVAQLDVELDLSSSLKVKDFEKFAGIDVAAIYLPSLDELRSFATLNIYFGPVEARPSPLKGVTQGGNEDRRWVRFFQQRLSLTVGVSTGDISGRSGDDGFPNNTTKARVSGNHAFLYGLGFRLNKHFRLAAGGTAFRNLADNTINHTVFVGPSIDLTGFKLLRGLVGKNK